MGEIKKSAVAEALKLQADTLWRNKEKLRKLERSFRFIFFVQIIITLINIAVAIGQTYIYSDSGAGIITGLAMGVLQIMIVFALLVPAYFALAKSPTASILMVVFHATSVILGMLFTNKSFFMLGIIGVFVYIYQLLQLRKFNLLKEEEGFPYFNERMEEYISNAHYSLEEYILPDDRFGDMSELTPDERAEYEALMCKNVCEVLEACTPQMDRVSVQTVADDEELTDVNFSSLDEVERHTQELARRKRMQDERIENLLKASQKKSEDKKNKRS